MKHTFLFVLFLSFLCIAFNYAQGQEVRILYPIYDTTWIRSSVEEGHPGQILKLERAKVDVWYVNDSLGECILPVDLQPIYDTTWKVIFWNSMGKMSQLVKIDTFYLAKTNRWYPFFKYIVKGK
jgi:hypothetical protein